MIQECSSSKNATVSGIAVVKWEFITYEHEKLNNKGECRVLPSLLSYKEYFADAKISKIATKKT